MLPGHGVAYEIMQCSFLRLKASNQAGSPQRRLHDVEVHAPISIVLLGIISTVPDLHLINDLDTKSRGLMLSQEPSHSSAVGSRNCSLGLRRVDVEDIRIRPLRRCQFVLPELPHFLHLLSCDPLAPHDQ